MQDPGYFAILSADINNLNSLNASRFRKNAENQIQNTLVLIEVDAQCQSSAAALLDSCIELADLAGNIVLTTPQKERFSALTEIALQQVDTFQKECERCGLNNRARNIGV